MITVLEKGRNPNVIAKNLITQRTGYATSEILMKILQFSDDKTGYYSILNKDLFVDSELYIRPMGKVSTSNDPVAVILSKMKEKTDLLGALCNINCGIQTGCDRIKTDDGHEGVFVLDDFEISDIPESEKSLLRPFYKNSDIKKYYCSSEANLRVIYTDRKFRNPSKYPKIISHLGKFRKKLSEIREVKNGIIKFYQLQWPREEVIFKSPKIVSPQRSRDSAFAYTESDWYASVDVYFITKRSGDISLKYLLTLLNSRLYLLWLYREGKRKGEMIELYQAPLSEIPIKKIGQNDQKPFMELADKILSITKDDDYLENQGKQSQVREYEKQIDQLVYQLYGLTPEEIAIVEGKTSS